MNGSQQYYELHQFPILNQQRRPYFKIGASRWCKHHRFRISWLVAAELWCLLSLILPCIHALQSFLPPPARLQQLLQSEMDGTRESDSPILLPCCYDGLTARLVARHQYVPSNAPSPQRFEATFLTGFGASASYGIPDTQLISYQEMLHTCAIVSEALASVALEQSSQHPIPCIADGDTGYGNAMNVKRTVFGYGRANMAGIMLEDQVAPKRCGHVAGKRIVPLNEAVQRIRAACDARDEYCRLYGPGTGPLILARTDACTAVAEDDVNVGFAEAMKRCALFREVGADMTFLEAPESVEQMQEYCRDISGPKLANMLEYGTTPILAPKELKQMGYTMAAYPLTLLSASIKAMQQSLDCIITGQPTEDVITSFAETKDIVGFTQYFREEDRYKSTTRALGDWCSSYTNMGGFQECCSLGLAVSNIVTVHASPSILWEVLTDFESLPQIVDHVQTVKIILPSSSLHSSTPSSAASNTGGNVLVGTQIYEERKIKNRVISMRRIITNFSENPAKNEYSISFNTYFDDEFPKSAQYLCNTSTLSIVASSKSVGVASCELLGSFAVEVSGCLYCPFLFQWCCKRRIEKHAGQKFAKELQEYAIEAQRRSAIANESMPPR